MPDAEREGEEQPDDRDQAGPLAEVDRQPRPEPLHPFNPPDARGGATLGLGRARAPGSKGPRSAARDPVHSLGPGLAPVAQLDRAVDF